jgi:hypothetical protein
MVKLGKIRRAAVLSVRLLPISSIFVIGLAPSARADDFQYTLTFDTFNAYGMDTSFSFDTTSLLGTTNASIDPSDVHIIAAPNSGGDVTHNTESLTASSSGFSFSLIARSDPAPCAGAFTNFNCINAWGTGVSLGEPSLDLFRLACAWKLCPRSSVAPQLKWWSSAFGFQESDF